MMTRYEFMFILKNNLRGMSEEEKQSILEYYEEYFDEAGPDKELDVVEELGNPKKLAILLSGESAVRSFDEENTHKSESGQHKPVIKTWLIIGALIIASPVILPLVIVAAVLLFVAVVIVLVFGGSAVIMALAGILSLFKGALSTGLTAIGTGMILFGVSVICSAVFKSIVKLAQEIVILFGKKKLIREANGNEQ